MKKLFLILCLLLALVCTACSQPDAAPAGQSGMANEATAPVSSPAAQSGANEATPTPEPTALPSPSPTPVKQYSADFAYIVLDDGSARLVQYSGQAETLTIPTELDGHPLTEIGENAFMQSRTLRHIVVPEGVTTLHGSAFFNCWYVESITLPASLTTLHGNPFYAMYGLTQFILPAEHPVLELVDGVLFNKNDHTLICYSSGMTAAEYTIPQGTLHIGNRAFACEDHLTSVTIPSSVTSIGDHAFRECVQLQRIDVPSSVTSLGECAFLYCSSLRFVTLPGSIQVLGPSTFAHCTSLASLALPEGMVSLGANVFNNCTALESVTLPASLTAVEGNPFGTATALQELTLPEGAGLKLVDGLLYSADGKTLFACLPNLSGMEIVVSDGVTSIFPRAFQYSTADHVTLPDSVTTLGSHAFYSADMRFVTLPAQLTAVPDYAFYDCTRLEAVELPPRLTAIGSHAFSNCIALETMALPQGVTRVEDSSFYKCKRLYRVELPTSLTYIGSSAFSGCDQLDEITIPSSVTEIHYSAFESSTRLVVPYRSYAHIFAREQYHDFETIPGDTLWYYDVLEDGTLRIAEYAGTDTSVLVPETIDGCTVTVIGTDAFISVKEDVYEVSLPYTVTTIEPYAFSGMTRLNSVNLPYNLTTLGEGAFMGCSQLRTVVIPKGVTALPKYVFAESGLTSLTLHEGITSIHRSALEGCSTRYLVLYLPNDPRLQQYAEDEGYRYVLPLAEYTYALLDDGTIAILKYNEDANHVAIPAQIDGYHVSAIGDNAFYDSSVVSVTIPEGVTSIGKEAFGRCSSLSSITLPSTLVSIGNEAFSRCSSLNTISFPANLREIGASAFSGAGLSGSLSLPDGLGSLGSFAFASTSLSSVTLPANLNSVGANPFQSCTQLSTIKVAEDNSTLSFSGGMLYDRNTCTVICYALNAGQTDCTFPEGTQAVGDYAFYRCEAFSAIVIPEGVTTIGSSAFNSCYALKRVTLPASLRSVGSYAFSLYHSRTFVVPRSSYADNFVQLYDFDCQYAD